MTSPCCPAYRGRPPLYQPAGRPSGTGTPGLDGGGAYQSPGPGRSRLCRPQSGLPPVLTRCFYAYIARNDPAGKTGPAIAAGFQGLEPPEEFLRLIKEYKVGNIILFRRNIQDGPQLKKLCATLRKVVEEETGVTPFITIDQEGGVVTRLPESEVNIPVPWR